jgi:hypothetical protein
MASMKLATPLFFLAVTAAGLDDDADELRRSGTVKLNADGWDKRSET